MVDCVCVFQNKTQCLCVLGVIVCCCMVWYLFVLLRGVHVIVCFVCELLRAVAWCSLVVVLVCVRFMCLCVLRDVLCDVVGFVFVVAFIRMGVLIICLLDVFMMDCVLVSGFCLCCFVRMRVGFNEFVRVVCGFFV